MSNVRVEIEQVDNGYVVINQKPLRTMEVYTDFKDVVDAITSDFNETGVGSRYTMELVEDAKQKE